MGFPEDIDYPGLCRRISSLDFQVDKHKVMKTVDIHGKPVRISFALDLGDWRKLDELGDEALNEFLTSRYASVLSHVKDQVNDLLSRAPCAFGDDVWTVLCSHKGGIRPRLLCLGKLYESRDDAPDDLYVRFCSTDVVAKTSRFFFEKHFDLTARFPLPDRVIRAVWQPTPNWPVFDDYVKKRIEQRENEILHKAIAARNLVVQFAKKHNVSAEQLWSKVSISPILSSEHALISHLWNIVRGRAPQRRRKRKAASKRKRKCPHSLPPHA